MEFRNFRKTNVSLADVTQVNKKKDPTLAENSGPVSVISIPTTQTPGSSSTTIYRNKTRNQVHVR